ncbi:MAG TPA: hypothetical protein VJM50_05665 [Pyrinomonadaceae bacterium]|nr:hypothetical protein [Pyrinomonadaceae bacterium]
MIVQKKSRLRRSAEKKTTDFIDVNSRDRILADKRPEDPPFHLDGLDLHNFFSKEWANPLTSEDRARISSHLATCSECARIGKAIQKDDKALERLIASSETAEDEANTMRSINVFRARMRKLAKKQKQITESEAPQNSQNVLWLTQSSESPLTALEMAEIVPELAEAVTKREISRALTIVDKHINQLQTVPLLQVGAIHLLAYCAWSIDYYGPHFDPVKEAVARFRRIPRKELTLSGLVLLNITEGLVLFHQEQYREAAVLFRQAQKDADRSEDAELMTVTRYYLGRVLWKLRIYNRSLEYIRDAISRDLASKNHARVAAMELVEGWLLFLKGEIRSSQRVLDRARARLGSRSDAWIDLGNILSFQGRLYRESGPEYYLKALDCFAEAIEAYRKHDPGHRNVARARINSAFVYRLISRDLGDLPGKEDRGQRAAEVQRLQKKAFDEIEEALTIYRFAKSRHLGALSRLHSIVALLYFDRCEFDKSSDAAEEAYNYANERGDKLGMANARIIQAKLALDSDLKGYVDAHTALSFAGEAIECASQTENRRVLARAYLRKAEVVLALPERDPFKAQQCLIKARKCLVLEDRDYLSSILGRVEREIEAVSEQRQRPDSLVTYLTVERVRQDIAAGCSLAEISEAHEERVIRFVYSQFCGGNITKAAAQLKTGARKVRRAITFYAISDDALKRLAGEGVDNRILAKLSELKGYEIQGHTKFVKLIRNTLDTDWCSSLESVILSAVYRSE